MSGAVTVTFYDHDRRRVGSERVEYPERAEYITVGYELVPPGAPRGHGARIAQDDGDAPQALS